MSRKTGADAGLTDGGITLENGAMPLSTRRSEETFFLADGTSYSHPNREYADDDESEDDTGLLDPAEPVNPALVDGLDAKLHADPDLAKLDRQEARLEGALDAGIHRRQQSETQHVIGGDDDDYDDESWGGSWKVEETGNGLVEQDLDRKS